MVTVGEGPEVSAVGATVVGDERVGVLVIDVVGREHNSMVVFAAVTVSVPLVTLEFVTGTAPPAVGLTGVGADF